MYKISLLYLVAPSLFLMSCVSPLPVSMLNPVNNDNSYWVNGTEIVTQTKDSVSIELGFVRREAYNYVFDFTVFNYSARAILVNPESIIYYPIDRRNDTLSFVSAVDPEYQILEQEKNIEKLEANKTNKLISGAILGSIELAADVTSIGKEKVQNDEDNYSALDRTSQNLAEIEYQKMNTINQLSYWETQVLRKTTVLPGHYVQGRILMRWSMDAKQVLVSIPIANHEFKFLFNQDLIRSR